MLVGKTAPNFSLQNLEGEMVQLDDYRGQPIFLNFWATWCQPCIVEHPVLQASARQFEGKVQFLGVVYHDEMVYCMEPDPSVKSQPWNAAAQAKLIAIASDSGEIRWTHDCGMWGHYNEGDVFPIDGLIWVHEGKSFAMAGLAIWSGIAY